MGEHENDQTIQEILATEAQQKARELAEQEAKELRKSVEAELTDIIEYNNNNNKSCSTGVEERRPTKKLADEGHTPIIDDLDIYCSVDELRDRMRGGGGGQKPNSNGTRLVTSANSNKTTNVLQEISNNNKHQNNNTVKNNTQKVAARVALWEHRLITERSTEILRGIQLKQEEKAKEAEEAAKSGEHVWKEQGELRIACANGSLVTIR